MKKPSVLQVAKYITDIIQPVREDVVYDITMNYYAQMSYVLGEPAVKETVHVSNGYMYCPDLNDFFRKDGTTKQGIHSGIFKSIEDFDFTKKERNILETLMRNKIGNNAYALRELQNSKESAKSPNKTNPSEKKPEKKASKMRIPEGQYIQKKDPREEKRIHKSTKKDSNTVRDAEDRMIRKILDTELPKSKNAESNDEKKDKFETPKNIYKKYSVIDIAHYFMSKNRKYTYHEMLGTLYYTYSIALKEWNPDIKHLKNRIFDNKFKATGNGLNHDDFDKEYSENTKSFFPVYTGDLPDFDKETLKILNRSYEMTRNVSSAAFLTFIKSSKGWKKAVVNNTETGGAYLNDIYIYTE